MRIITLCLLLFLFFGCKKQVIKQGQKHLPKETAKGKGIFACHIDNQTLILRQQEEVTYNSTTGYLALNVFGKRGKEFRLFVYSGIFSPGLYQFDLTQEEYIPTKNSAVYGIAETGINQLEVKALSLDIENRFIAGTFDFDLINENEQIINVRHGRFDLALKIIN